MNSGEKSVCVQARDGPFIVQIFVVSRGNTSYNMQEFIFFVSLVECKAELDRIDSRLSQIQQSSDDFRLDFQQSKWDDSSVSRTPKVHRSLILTRVLDFGQWQSSKSSQKP